MTISERIGIDVGGSGIKAARVDLTTGALRDRDITPTPQPATPAAVAATVAKAVARLASTGGVVGCTLPSVVTVGVIRTAAHLDRSWIGTDAPAVFAQATGRRFVVLNDADAAGLAEMHFGAGLGHDGVVVMVTLGTGVGTALFADGRLVPNTELGHVDIEGTSADSWVSGAAKVRDALGWDEWAKRLDLYLHTLHTLLWPDLIVIGGGMVEHADKFLARLDPGCEVRIAQFANDAGIVGVALASAEDASIVAETRVR